MYYRLRRYFFIIMSTSLYCTGAISEASSLDDSSDFFDLSLEELLNIKVITASRYEHSRGQAPARIEVINRSTIRMRGYRHLSDLLHDLPSIAVLDFADSLTMRGSLGTNRILILHDGVRIGSAGGEALAITGSFPLYHAERVEVLYGPASVVYGEDAYSGVINIISRREPEVAITLNASNTEAYHGSVFLSGHLTEDISASVGGFTDQSPDYSDFIDDNPDFWPRVDAVTFGGVVVEAGDNRDFNVSPTENSNLFWRVSYRDSIEFGGSYSTHSESNNLIALTDNTVFDRNATLNTRYYTAYIVANHEFTPALKSSSQISYHFNELEPDSYYKNRFSDFTLGYKYSLSKRLSFEQLLMWQHERHAVIFGFNYSDIEYVPIGPDLPEKYDTGQSAASQESTYLYTDIPIDFFEDADQTQAFFVQDEITLKEGYLFLTGGLHVSNNTRYGSSSNMRLALNLIPSAQTSVKLLYGEAFLAPASHQAFISYGSFNDLNGDGVADINDDGNVESFFFHRPNPDLEAEELQVLELNLRHAFSSTLRLSASLYMNRTENSIRPAIDDIPVQFIPGATIFVTESNVNDGESRSGGGDIGLEWQYQVSAITGMLWSNYSHVSTKGIDSTGRSFDSPFIPEQVLKAGIDLSYRMLSASLRGRWLNRVTLSTDKGTSGSKVKSGIFGVLDLTVRAQINPQLSGYLDIRNLFDSTQKVPAGLFASQQEQIPQEPRVINIGINYDI